MKINYEKVKDTVKWIVVIAISYYALSYFSDSKPKIEYRRAYLMNRGEAMQAIAEIEKIDGDNLVTALYLPYHKKATPDIDPFEDGEIGEFSGQNTEWEIDLGSKVKKFNGTELDQSPISISGAFRCSINGERFHWWDCHYVQNINRENMIFISNPEQAYLMGYKPCSYCSSEYDFW